MKTMLVLVKPDETSPGMKIYKEFNLYGQRWCICHDLSGFPHQLCIGSFYHVNHYSTGAGLTNDFAATIEGALRLGRKKLLQAGRKRVLKAIKKWPVINK